MNFGIEYMGPRRRSPKWKRPLSLALWIFVILLAIGLWLYGMWSQSSFSVVNSTLNVRMAGFGVPDWVAFALIGTLVLMWLGVCAQRAMHDSWYDEHELRLEAKEEQDAKEGAGV
jgi:hypothetical protein